MKDEQIKRGRGRQPEAIPMDTLWRKPDAMPTWAQPKTLSEALDAVREMRATGGKEAALALWEAMGLPPMVAPEPPLEPSPIGLVRRFVRERVAKAPGRRVASAALWDAMQSWSHASRLECPSRTRLGVEMRRAGFKSVEVTGRMFYDGAALTKPRNPEKIGAGEAEGSPRRR